MLLELHISGLGVIEDVSLELPPGLSVLTGETGAGKTMVTVGLALALGRRASQSLLRQGSAAQVQARFAAPDRPEIKEWTEDGEVVMARRIEPSGRGTAGGTARGTARLSGQLVPVSTLASIAPLLVEVHGQNEHQRLLSPGAQTAFLDRFAGADHLREVERHRRRYAALREVRDRLVDLDRAAREREREKDLLAYQVREIEAAAVEQGELSAMAEEEARLGHAERLAELSAEAGSAVDGGAEEEGGAADGLRRAASAMARAAQIDPSGAGLAARLASLAEEASDTAVEVRAYHETARADPARLGEVSARIAAIRGLERKYGEGEEGILSYLAGARDRLASLEGSDEQRAGLAEQAERLGAEAAELAARVRRGREAAAASLSGALEVELWDLGMEGAGVSVQVEPQEHGPDGTERAEILFSGGPGQAPLPLRSVASGGELSRTMLACRSVLADLDDVPTLVFDEVDAGIGGQAGVAVGRRLARIARTRQVLVVTHLPQIAAFADRHFRVAKRGGTATVEVLDEAGRVAELSRMLAGLPESDAASSHAEELLAEAAREKGR